MLKSFPYTPTVPSKAALIQVVIPVTHLLLGDLAVAPLTVLVRRDVLLQNLDAIPQVHPVKVVTQFVSCEGQPWAPWKG